LFTNLYYSTGYLELFFGAATENRFYLGSPYCTERKGDISQERRRKGMREGEIAS
jgi:hypothetical protein